MREPNVESVVAAVSGEGLVRAVLGGRRRGRPPRWRRVTVRPVAVRGEPLRQFVFFDERKSFTKNLALDRASAELEGLLTSGFSSVVVETRSETLQLQVSRRGETTLHRAPAARPAPPLAHDRDKPKWLEGPDADRFLSALGITGANGKVRSNRHRKLRQIDQFLSLVADAVPLDRLDEPVRVVDLGCGHAYLTFALYHLLKDVRGIATLLTGVDANPEAVERNIALAEQLGWENLSFSSDPIVDYEPESPPDMVLALHACDTATDDALARAVRWRSRFVFTSPCCHHHLNAQLRATGSPAGFDAVTRHGILRERLGDVLTDSFRAALLTALGYRTEVVEFVSAEHTARNLLLRAVRTGATDPLRAAEYVRLRDAWQVKPYLEELLADELASLLED
jgi:SAM-dependent methyltransferase